MDEIKEEMRQHKSHHEDNVLKTYSLSNDSIEYEESVNHKEDASENEQIEKENKLVLKGFHSTLNHSNEESEINDES